MRPKAEQLPLLREAQAVLQGKLDGGAEATLLELSVVLHGTFVGLFVVSDGTSCGDREEVLRQRKADLGLGAGSKKTLKDVSAKVLALVHRPMAILYGMTASEPDTTVPSAADFEECYRLKIEGYLHWEACRRGGWASRGGGSELKRRVAIAPLALS